MRRSSVVLAVVLALVAAALVCFQVPYANGPAEWRWEFRPLGLAPGWAIVAAALAALTVWLGGTERLASRGGASLAFVVGSALSAALLLAQPAGFDRVAASLAAKQTFGYLFDAALAPPNAELLADYTGAARPLSMHSRTHPPGPILAIRALDRALRALPLPGPETSSLAARAQSALDAEARRERDHRRPAPAELPNPWTLIALAALLPLSGAAIAWPLRELGARVGVPPAALSWALALWVLVPARTVFTPSLDQALPGLVVAAVWAALGGGAGVLVAGALAGTAAWMSYGFVPWIGLVALFAWLGGPVRPAWTLLAERARWARTAAFLGAAALPWLALLPSGFMPLASLRAALAAHHAMAIATRSYGLWLAWNPYDFALLLGPGVALLAALAAARAARTRAVPADALDVGGAAAAAWWSLPFAGALLLLWLAGSVRGEVGRIWLFFMPFACLAAASVAPAGPTARRSVLAAQAGLLFALAASLVFVS